MRAGHSVFDPARCGLLRSRLPTTQSMGPAVQAIAASAASTIDCDASESPPARSKTRSIAGASRQLPIRLQGRRERTLECPAMFDKVRNDNGMNAIRRLHEAFPKPGEHGDTLGFRIPRRVPPGDARI